MNIEIAYLDQSTEAAVAFLQDAAGDQTAEGRLALHWAATTVLAERPADVEEIIDLDRRSREAEAASA